jgi:CheY-like chemotaxis protein
MAGRILTVEDDAAIRALIVSILESDGHELFQATDGLRALAIAQDCSPDVILLDIGLPGQDGFVVLDELKADEQLRDVPVLMVTAWADPELVGRAMDRGAAGYIRKPFDIEDLREQVGQALAGEPAT